ncbi:hypothetical protein M426DRAFT_27601 [Hypoxylon sp. CI-4A]|nr:hypothetical protein M426DRAFT_27601 [Hypoxylon sp. CI-4A]
MTTQNLTNVPLATGATTGAAVRDLSVDIEQVDAFARKLYKRARTGGPDLEEVATAVRSLHTVLKHLKFEAEDPESLLSIDDSAVYARQLTPILEDSEFALKQLDTIIEKYGGGNSSDGDGSGGAQMDGEKGWTMLENRERDMIDLIRAKLANQKLNIDMFLDTIQLHNPSKSRRMVDTNSADLESIKDKVDAIATRICQRKNSNLTDGGDEEELWAQFRDELERAGFSRDVLRKNQDVIRAYIRQLDEQLSANGGSTPSVRGLLEHYRPQRDVGLQLQITPYPTYPAPAELSPEEIHSSGIDEEKLFPSMRMKRLQEEEDEKVVVVDNKNNNKHRTLPPTMPDHPTFLSYDRHSSSGDDDEESMALISTRELMALDRRASDLAVTMGNRNLQPPALGDSAGANYNMSSTSPAALRQLPPTSSQPALPPPPSAQQITNGGIEPSSADPRYAPPPTLFGSSPPLNLHANSISAPAIGQQALTLPSPRSARLAPDSRGHEIPLEAKWTRISRRLVSPEVLASAGVRYEARPDFVAVLGELSRDQVVNFAKRTAEVRGARRRRSSTVAIASGMGNGVRKERRTEDKYHPDKYRNWAVIEEERQRGERLGDKAEDRNGRDTDDDYDSGVTYVVNNNTRRRKGSTASSVSALYDSSDDERTSGSDADSQYSSSYSQSYPHSSAHLDDYHKSRSNPHRRSYTAPSVSSATHDDRTRSRSKVGADKVGDGDNDRHSNEKSTKAYPFIVPPPNEKDKDRRGSKSGVGVGASPAATVMPKPILKNKNDDPHVRIDPTPQIIDEGSTSLPRNLPSYRRSERERERRERDKDRDKDRTRDRDRDRDRDRERDRDRDREKRYRSDRHSDRDRDHRGDRHREKEYHNSHRDRDRDPDGHEEYSSSHRRRHSSQSQSHGHRYHGGVTSSSTTSRRDRDRERDYHDDHYVNSNNRPREDRSSKKKARDETLRAVGIGGAAAAMLSMLSEAAL